MRVYKNRRPHVTNLPNQIIKTHSVDITWKNRDGSPRHADSNERAHRVTADPPAEAIRTTNPLCHQVLARPQHTDLDVVQIFPFPRSQTHLELKRSRPACFIQFEDQIVPSVRILRCVAVDHNFPNCHRTGGQQSDERSNVILVRVRQVYCTYRLNLLLSQKLQKGATGRNIYYNRFVFSTGNDGTVPMANVENIQVPP